MLKGQLTIEIWKKPFYMSFNTGSYGSQNVHETNLHVFDLKQVRKSGITRAASLAIQKLMKDDLVGFWIHLDVDVLDEVIMPAVDYRLEGGLCFSDLSGRTVGMDIAILNPV
jgi:arginase